MANKPQEFLRVLKHQLKGPLTLIRGYLSFWESDAYTKFPPEKQKEFIRKAANSARMLDTLINDVFLVLMLETKKTKPEREMFDAETILRELYQQSFAAISERKQLVFQIQSSISPFPITTDKSHFLFIFEKLLNNAVRYTDQGSITITLKRNQKSAILEISDTGKGFSSDEKKFAFVKMFHNSLSLYLVKALIALLGGTIRLSSNQPQGSRFIIILPQH